MNETEEDMKYRLRLIPLLERLDRAESMVGKMCAESRPPAMTIPVRWDDEDQFITVTLQDAAVYVKWENFRNHLAMAALQGLLAFVGGSDHNQEMFAEHSYRIADTMLEARKGKPKDEFVRPDLLLAGHSTWGEIQKALDDPRYKTVSVEAGHLEGVDVHVPVGKSLTLRPPLEEDA